MNSRANALKFPKSPCILTKDNHLIIPEGRNFYGVIPLKVDGIIKSADAIPVIAWLLDQDSPNQYLPYPILLGLGLTKDCTVFKGPNGWIYEGYKFKYSSLVIWIHNTNCKYEQANNRVSGGGA